VWSPTENILWNTEIEGNGASSPVVWGDRVFLTTAVERSPIERGPALVLAFFAALLALTALVLKGNQNEAPSSKRLIRIAHRLDRLGTTFALLLCPAAVIFLYIQQDSFGPGLEQAAWNYTCAVGILACVAVMGLFHACSPWRPVGSVALVAIVILFQVGAPIDISFKGRVLMGGALGASLWFCLLYLASRRETPIKTPGRRGAAWQAVGTFALLLTAVVPFAVFNCLPRYAAWTHIVICLDAETGDILWHRDCFRTGSPKRGHHAMPTPVVDGDRVVAQFSPGLVCLDFQGHVKWQKAFPDHTEHFHYGAASSPIMFEQSVIYAFLPDGLEPASNDDLARYSQLSALDKETGDEKWKVQLPGGHDSYNTPLLARVSGRAVLLIATWGHLLAYDPSSGMLLRSWDLPVHQCVPSIVASGERVYVMSGRDHGSQGGFAIDLTFEEADVQPDIAWRVQRASADISSPVLCEGLLFMVTRSGIASCLEAETGRVLWKERFPGSHFSSVVAGDGKVYFTSLDGKTTVIALGQTCDGLAENSIGTTVSASPAIANGRLFIRGERHLFCIGSRDERE